MGIRRLTGALVAAGLVALAAWFVASSAFGASARETATPGEPAAGDAVPSPGAPDGPAQQAAEGFEWFWAINGPVSADGGEDLSVDAEGNVFLAGSHGGLDMDGDGVVDLPSAGTAYQGARNSFFMKLDRGPSDDRVRLRWTRTPGNPADRADSRIAADGRGGAYVSGSFQESLSFEGGPVLRGAGGNDAWVAHYEDNGSVTWARAFGGPGGDVIRGLASDREGGYVVGTGGGTFPLHERVAEFRGSGERSAGLVSYGPDGVVRWTRMFVPGAQSAQAIPPVIPFHVSVAPNGEVFVVGQFEVAVDFDEDGVIELPAPRDRDGFVARFDADGGLLGAWAVGAPGSLTFNPEGDLFLLSILGAGIEEAFGPADFDGDGRADVEPSGGYATGAVIARYSRDGDLRWVRSYALDPADMAIGEGRIALSGSYSGLRDLDEDGVPETRLDAPEHVDEETDLAILLLSAGDGRIERVWTAPGQGSDVASAVAFLPDEPAVIVTGSIRITADFTGDGERGEGWVVCENLGDVFFAQYRLPERVEEIRAEAREEPAEIVLEASLAEHDGRQRRGPYRRDRASSGLAPLRLPYLCSRNHDLLRNGGRGVLTVPHGETERSRPPEPINGRRGLRPRTGAPPGSGRPSRPARRDATGSGRSAFGGIGRSRPRPCTRGRPPRATGFREGAFRGPGGEWR